MKGMLPLALMLNLLTGNDAYLSGNFEEEANIMPPKIKKGMKYEKARRLLLKHGWQTVQMHATANGSHRCWKTWDAKDSYSCRFQEIDDCSGTGMGYCLMWFYDGDKYFLKVRTAGGEPPYAMVDDWQSTTERPMIDKTL